MAKTIDMQLMRYINLFEKISRVSTTDCFIYNNTIFFAVPKALMMQAIGRNGENVKRISETFSKRIKVVSMPSDKEILDDKMGALKRFITEVVLPVEFTGLDFNDDVVVLSGSRESKAILIGRDRSREKELAHVLEKIFGVKAFKIV